MDPVWTKPEADQLLHYFKVIRQQSATTPTNFSAAGAALHSAPTSAEGDSITLVSPAHAHLLYFISWIAHFVLPSTDKAGSAADLSSYQLHCLMLLAKVVVLLVDSLLLVFSTTLYVRLTYHKFKKQLRSCYLAVILLCPAFFLREYMHFDLHCVGHHLLFLALFLHEVDESLLVAAISAFLCAVNPVYMLLPLFLLSSQMAKSVRKRFMTETGIFRPMYAMMDVGAIVGVFAFVFTLFALPWAMQQDDWLGGLWQLAKDYVLSAAVS